MEGFGPRWAREKLLGLWDPLAMGLSHPSTSAPQGSEEGVLLAFDFIPAPEHLAETVLAQKMLWFICHSWLAGFTDFPSSGQGGTVDVPVPTEPREQESGSELSVCSSVHGSL